MASREWLLSKRGTLYYVTDSGCWLWRGAVDGDGYGRLSARLPGEAPRTWGAHRLAYTLLCGPIPNGMQTDHLCRMRACINPSHMEIVTLVENVRRGNSPAAIAGRRSCCKYGHPYPPEPRRKVDGSRRCYVCQRAAYQRRLMAAGPRG